MEPTEETETSKCVSCGKDIPSGAPTCPHCGKAQIRDYSMHTARPKLAGALLILSGVFALIMGAGFLAVGVDYIHDIADIGGVELPDWVDEDILVSNIICGGLGLFFGGMAIVGGILSIKRSNFILVAIGGIFGVLGLGFFVGSLLAIFALAFAIMARKEYK